MANGPPAPRLAAGYETYRRMRRDPTIALARALAVAPVVAGEWTVQSDADVPQEVRGWIDKQFLTVREPLLETTLKHGYVDFGHQGFELIWGLDAGGRPPAPTRAWFSKSNCDMTASSVEIGLRQGQQVQILSEDPGRRRLAAADMNPRQPRPVSDHARGPGRLAAMASLCANALCCLVENRSDRRVGSPTLVQVRNGRCLAHGRGHVFALVHGETNRADRR